MICTAVNSELRSVFFLWLEGVTTPEIYRRFVAQCGEHYMAQKNLCELVDKFKRGRTRLDSGERSGRHSTSRTDGHHAEVDVLIKENRLL